MFDKFKKPIFDMYGYEFIWFCLCIYVMCYYVFSEIMWTAESVCESSFAQEWICIKFCMKWESGQYLSWLDFQYP